ncbi:MAG: hypothetical protein EOS41_23605 [Mesorhizobium sp.]|uniref:ABC transporter substrate-binding protein n=1 Tax=Mesorhizobium sp. TaxID=1871066 RepID=UPI000FE751C7|nr:ABC transporter substrate-binding protein [Mesorhizobium sp.]RWE22869.1 MAG: hypothetical protein EOS41_23605 [Mesorhizobium sp.]
MKHLSRAFIGGVLIFLSWIAPSHSADKAKITLNWTPDAYSAGIIYAKEQGIYAREQIEVEIEPGKGSGTTSQLVAAGSTDLGYANAGSAISLAAKGAPITIIAPVTQAVEWGITSLADTPINTPKDLEGKTIAIAPGSADIPLFEAMIAASGVDKSKINIISADSATFIGLLADKKIDGASGAPGDYLVPMAAKGIAAKHMYYRDYGAPLIGLSLIANSQKLKENPDLYKRLVKATLEGYAEAAKNPDAAIDTLLKNYPLNGNREELIATLKQYTIPSLCAKGAAGLGKAPDAIWQITGEVLTKTYGSLGDGGIKALYTNDYLPQNLPACP